MDGSRPIVAITVFGHWATAEQDLNTYRAKFNLSPCTTANGCFTEIDNSGGASSLSWEIEGSLDLDVVSAICPDCRLMLYEASADDDAVMTQAVQSAAAAGANVVNMSWGEHEGVNETFAAQYDIPGVALVAASGDSGYGATLWPAAYATVLAAGGTNLTWDRTSNTFSETAWGASGSGCSQVIAKPVWQTDTGCTTRTIADVSANANTTFCDSYFAEPGTTFTCFAGTSGTSVSSPIWAGVIALRGVHATQTFSPAVEYSDPSLHDVTSGSSGTCDSYLCNAGVGYDGPTGNGTP